MLKDVQQGTAHTPYTYLYGPDGQVLGQVRYTSNGKKSKASYYVWLDSLPIAQIDLTYDAVGTTIASITLTYLHSDHLNTPRLATNQGGNLVWSWQSDAFGVGQPNTYGGNIDVILRFPGQVADAHSALYYNYFRDYDPETGRYVVSDPIGLLGGKNTYTYVRGSVLRFIDPKGLDISVIENGATDGNPIGHTAIAITGAGVYSFGNTTAAGSSLKEYALRESPRRNSKIYIVKTTPEQDKAALNYLATLQVSHMQITVLQDPTQHYQPQASLTLMKSTWLLACL